MADINELSPPDLVHLPDLYVSRKSFLKIVGRELSLEITLLVIILAVFIFYAINRERKLREYEQRLKKLPPEQ